MPNRPTGPAEGEALRRLAQELVDRYTKAQPVAERHGGCGWCGGLPHSVNCLVGRMEAALAPLSGPVDADYRSGSNQMESGDPSAPLIVPAFTVGPVDASGEPVQLLAAAVDRYLEAVNSTNDEDWASGVSQAKAGLATAACIWRAAVPSQTYTRTDSEAAAWREIARRSDEAHAYCHAHDLRIGQNIWHAILDDAIQLSAAAAVPSSPAQPPIPDISTTDLGYAANLIENRIDAEAPEFRSLLRGRVDRIRNLNIWLSKHGPYGTAAALPPSSPAQKEKS